MQGIDEAILISAYDIHHKLVADHGAFESDFARSRYANPRLLLIDSGWYEKSVGPESGEWYHKVGPVLPFDEDDYVSLIDRLDPELEAVLVGWDAGERADYEHQLIAAQAFFGKRKRFTAEVLLRPEPTSRGKRRRYHDISSLSPATAARLRAFSVVGVTEKELGDTVLKRLTNLASLRVRLDEAGVELPIHVFGGLDPLATPLYFAAGAEIFDGLSWLRYAFHDGLALYRESMPILNRQYEKRLSLSVASTQLQNLDALSELTRELKVCFHNNMDWGKVQHGDVLRRAHEAMESAIGEQHGR